MSQNECAAFMRKHVANQTCDYNYRMTGAYPAPGISCNSHNSPFQRRTPPVSPLPFTSGLRLPVITSAADWAKKLTDAVFLRQKSRRKPLRPQIAIFSNADFRNITFRQNIAPSSWSETAILLRVQLFKLKIYLFWIYLIYILTNADSLIRH